jgi:PAT family beta-lactamase induction signal transducer AmpG
MAAGFLSSLRVYAQPRLLAVLLMGFSSGLPLALTGATLSFRLTETGVSLTAVGLFSLVAIPYSLKFLWSPAIDRLPLPILTSLFGRRRGWALLIQLALAAAIVTLGLIDPRVAPWWTALLAVVVAFLSASQDIVIDAYRVELLRADEQGAGAAATQFGYRFGMIASSAGALYAAAFGGWEIAYMAMAMLMGVGFVTVLLTPEPVAPARVSGPLPGTTPVEKTVSFFRDAVVGPFRDFGATARPYGTSLLYGWVVLLVFVVLYKFGDALAGSMATAFYVKLGFTKEEVASISKVFGVFATLAGVAAGGAVVYRWGIHKSLLVCGLLQMLSNLTYVAQAYAGHDVLMLTATIGAENFSGGMGSAAFVAYLSGLCNRAFTATQYALLSSLATVGRTTLAASGGWLAERLDWAPFFLLTTAAALPGLLLLFWMMRRFPTSDMVPGARPAE